MVNEQNVNDGYVEDAPDMNIEMELDEPQETVELVESNFRLEDPERISRLVKETMRGVHGVGERRRKALGADYEAVTDEVRRIRLQGA